MPTTQGCYQAVLTVANSIGEANCSESAKAVFKALLTQGFNAPSSKSEGTAAEFVTDLNQSPDAIFLVSAATAGMTLSADLSVSTINNGSASVTAGSAFAWGHCFVVQKVAGVYMVYQSFISSYKLSEWMSGQFLAPASSPNVAYTPQGGANVPNNQFGTFCTQLLALGSAANVTAAQLIAQDLFGGAPKFASKLNTSFSTGIRFAWFTVAAATAAPQVQGNLTTQSSNKCKCTIM